MQLRISLAVLLAAVACSDPAEVAIDSGSADGSCLQCDADVSAPDASDRDSGVSPDAEPQEAGPSDAAGIDAGDEGGAIVLSQSQIAFGTVPVGAFREVPLTITNPNAFDVEVGIAYDDQVRSCGATARGEPFCLDAAGGAQGSRLGAGASVVVSLRFAPSSPGTRAAGRVELSTCSGRPECQAQIVLDGLAAGLDCGSAPLQIGGVAAGQCITRDLVCANPSALPLQVAGWSLPLSTPAGFTVEPSQARTVGSEDTISIELGYCGSTTPGVEQATLQIGLVAPTSPLIDVPLRASSGPPDITLVPAALDFGEIAAGAPTRRTIWVENHGGATLRLTGMNANVDGNGGFAVLNPPGPLGVPVPAGQRLAFTVEVMVGTGTVTNTLQVHSNDPDTPQAPMSLRAVALASHPYCSIQVVPYELPFGYVLRQTAAEAFLAVYSPNFSAPSCPVGGQRLSLGSDPAYTLIDPVQGSLRRLERRLARVRYSPTEVSIAAQEATIETYARSPMHTTRITGFAAEDGLIALPNALDFGVAQPGCTNLSRRFLLVNASAAPSVVFNLQVNPQWSASTITLGGLPSMPHTVPPGGHLELTVTIDPGMISTLPVLAQIEIYTATGWRTVAVALEVQAAPQRIERFSQGPYDAADILFVSSLGARGLERLRTALPRAVAAARGLGVDYHVAVLPAQVTGHPGEHLPAGFSARDRVATEASLPSAEARLETMLPWPRTIRGQDQGLEQTLQSLLPPASRTSNAEFYRAEAPLGVIVVSDRDDASPRGVSAYAAALGGLKNDRHDPPVSVSGLVGPSSAPCNSSTIAADAAPRYNAVIASTGGLAESICEADWALAVERMVARASGIRDRFELAQEPYLPSLEVFVQGVEVPREGPFGTINWRLDHQAVVFLPGALPAPRATVEVRYEVPCPTG